MPGATTKDTTEHEYSARVGLVEDGKSAGPDGVLLPIATEHEKLAGLGGFDRGLRFQVEKKEIGAEGAVLPDHYGKGCGH